MTPGVADVSRSAGVAELAPFATALRTAIESSGLGLEQLQRRLSRGGHDVSLAALSYWRSGRSRPSRKSSVDAVAALEPMLGLAPGALTGLLPDAAVDDAGPIAAPPLDPVLAGVEPGRLSAGLASLLETGRERVELVSDHQSAELDAERRCTAARTRRIYRALTDGVDRVLIATALPDGVPAEPGPLTLHHGRAIDRVVLADHGVVLTELALDRTLRRGEAIMLELDLERSPGVSTGTPRELCGSVPLRELVVEVRFDPRAQPLRVEWYEGESDAAASITALTLDSTSSVLVVRHDVRAVRHGVRWDWPSAAG